MHHPSEAPRGPVVVVDHVPRQSKQPGRKRPFFGRVLADVRQHALEDLGGQVIGGVIVVAAVTGIVEHPSVETIEQFCKRDRVLCRPDCQHVAYKRGFVRVHGLYAHTISLVNTDAEGNVLQISRLANRQLFDYPVKKILA